MNRLFPFAILCIFAAPALAQAKDDDVDDTDEKTAEKPGKKVDDKTSKKSDEKKPAVVTPATAADDDLKDTDADKKLARPKSRLKIEVKDDDETEEKDGDFAEEKSKRFPTFQLHGYYRLRGVLNQNFDLKTASGTGAAFQGSSKYWVPYSAETGVRTDSHTIAGANMRLRLEPTIKVSEKVRIRTEFDILDNVVLGETPDGFPDATLSSPLIADSQSILPPTSGVNSWRDAIRVKRVWGEVNIPFGNLFFGRMGNHWGMGLRWNDGNCQQSDYDRIYGWARDPEKPGATGPRYGSVNHRQLLDCNYGDTVDRLKFTTRIEDFVVGVGLDFGSEGLTSALWNSSPTLSPIDRALGQAIDRDQLDDVAQYNFFILRRDTDSELKRKFELNLPIFNFGAMASFRTQAFTTEAKKDGTEVTVLKGGTPTLRPLGFESLTVDLWAIFLHKRWRIEAELVGVWGKYEANDVVNPAATAKTEINQQGAVVRGMYRFLTGELYLGIEGGIASGDKDDGFGVRDKPVTDTNRRIGNFRFDPDFHVDLILFREIIGTVTNAWYVKPWVTWEIVNGFGIRLDAVSSWALKASSTPGKNIALGTELDVDIFYYSDDGFHAGFSFGWLIPWSGMDFVDAAGVRTPARAAFSLQTRLAISF